MAKRLRIPKLGTPKTVKAEAKVEQRLGGRMTAKKRDDTLKRLHARGVARAKRDRASIAEGKPSKWHKRAGSTVADMDRLIKVLEKKSGSGGGYPINPKLGGRDVGGRKSPWRKRRILE